MRRISGCRLLIMSLALCGAANAGSVEVESFEWLPEFGPSNFTGPYAMNNLGEFVGKRITGGIVVWVDGAVNEPASPVCNNATLTLTPRGITDSAFVVGYASCANGPANDVYDRGFFINKGSTIVLRTEDAEYTGVNNAITIVGRFFNNLGENANRAFRIDEGVLTLLDPFFRPTGIDLSGRMFGTNINTDDGFYTKQGGRALVNLGSFGGVSHFRVNRVSKAGDFAGNLRFPGPVTRAFAYINGVGHVIPNVPGATIGDAYAVTLDGKVIGRDSNAPSFDVQNWVWDGQQRYFMPDILEPFLGFRPTIFTVVAASEEGWILGFGREPVSNSSRIFRCKIRVELPDIDTDEDGLPDEWELDGIPYTDSKGEQQRYMLPGADPGRKDLYVEVDSGIIPFSQESAALVIAAFAQAPVSNPDGTTGITLHVLLDETNLPLVGNVPDPHDFPSDFHAVKEDHFGTALERADPDAEALLGAKARAYRYGLAYDGLVFPKGIAGYGGIAELHGSNLILDMAAIRADSAVEDAAAIFMHELGHTLGLDHGGGDGVQGKPNYFSIMNYAAAYRLPYNSPYWRLDYSREELAPLDENILDEAAGIDSTLYRACHMPYGVGPEETRSFRLVKLSGVPTDFDDSGQVMGLTIQDLNFIGPDAMIGGVGDPTPDEELHGFNDWANLKYDIPLLSLRQIAAGCPNDETIAFLEKSVPLPCFADIDTDGFIGFADLNAVISRFNTADGDAAYDAAADIDIDGFIGFSDLNEVLGRFNQPCD